ncbi:MAG TPA: hypothetical protein VHE32_08765 [Rhodanobacteraceae bacterium]|nr:hypothetical protein [Rhodanobacteraceae bacterium]
MGQAIVDDAFERFVLDRKADLARIARRTRGEYSFDDACNEAWLMATTVSVRYAIPIEFLSRDFQEKLLGHLHKHLVCFTDLNVRHAVRLDHAPKDDAARGSAHPLARSMVADAGNDPLSHLAARDDAAATAARCADGRHSLAAAYVILLSHFGNEMRRVADHLLISRSYAYRCCAKARRLVVSQRSLALSPPSRVCALRSWRRRRMPRIPRQMEFDFDEGFRFCESCKPAPLMPVS